MADEVTPSGGYMLTTVDNPWDPFTQFDEWLAYDTGAGYNTCGLLARVVVTSDELSEADQALATQDAIEEIVHENVLGIFRKVSRDSFEHGIDLDDVRGSVWRST